MAGHAGGLSSSACRHGSGALLAELLWCRVGFFASLLGHHIRSIYAKLQVSERSSAVQRVRELRLLAVAR